jgi:RNA-directed DNA polymerase
MRELYIEGVATHGGPESCVGVREGTGEALTGVRAGWAIEPRNDNWFGVPTSSRQAEGNIVGGVTREPSADPARSENLCTYGISMFENREVPWPPVLVDDAPSWMVRGVADRRVAGREVNAEAVSPR